MYKKEIIKNRPAFQVDKALKDAAKKAARAFEQEEKDLEKYKYAKI
jgi:hypothetical protein